MKGPEGMRIFTGAEERLARKEGTKGTHELIEAHMKLAEQAVIGAQLMAALEGENFFKKVDSIGDEESELNTAMFTLKNSPFVGKLLPDQLTDDRERAAFLVAFAHKRRESRESMH